MNKKLFFIIFFLIFSFKFTFGASNIDPVYKYAWGDTIGWVNFGCDNCNLNVYNDKITGYAWSQNYGWINFSPTNGGVFNDGQGNLSGYAWGENLGWIDFSNVKINPSTGEFSGYAVILGGPGGKINFDCNNCQVKTSWRVSSPTPPSSPPIISGSSFISSAPQVSTSTILTIIELIGELLTREKTIKSSPMPPSLTLPTTTLSPEFFETTTETSPIFKEQPIEIATTIPPFVFEPKKATAEQPQLKLPISLSYLEQILILMAVGIILIFVLLKINK